MPTLIKLQGEAMVLANDAFTHVADDQDLPQGDVIISLTRFQADGERLLGEGRSVGVRLEPNEEAEALAYDLPRLAVVALAYPKFRDGRQYSNAGCCASASASRARSAPSATCCASRPASWSAAGSTRSSRPTARRRTSGRTSPSASATSISAPLTREPAFAERGR